MSRPADRNTGVPSYGLFNDSFPPILDGVTLTVENYARRLDSRGLNPCVVTPWNPLRYEPGYAILRYFSLPIRGRRPYRYGYPKLDPMIWHRLRQKTFSIVHAHCPFSSGRLAWYTARRQHIPFVATFHSKYKVDLDRSLRHVPWIIKNSMRKMLALYNACDEVWIPQPAVEATVREYGFKGPLVVMENGADFDLPDGVQLDDFKCAARKRIGIPDDCFSLLFVGQHIWEKGIGVIAEALSKLPSHCRYVMNFVGDGYARADLIRLVEKLGISGRVKVRGVISDRDSLRDYYAAADLFLFPSYYDNAPLVVREAAAMGTPALMLAGSTAAEVITDNDNGFLTDRTAEAYARAIESLGGRRGDVRRAGRRARATLIRPWADIIDEAIDRYDTLINCYKNRHAAVVIR